MSEEARTSLEAAIARLNMDAAQTEDTVYRDECFHMIRQIKSLVEAYKT